MLIGNLIISFLESTAGSDIYVSTMVVSKDLPELELRKFLTEQQNKDDHIVSSFSFGSRSVYSFVKRETGLRLGFR